MTLTWTEETDDYDNITYIAHGPYADGFKWRIVPALRNNRLFYIANHDQELGGDWDCVHWYTIEDAKEAIEEAHNRTLEDCE